MPLYVVRWEIDIEADTPRQAAEKALEIQRDPDSSATVFDVWVHGTPTVIVWEAPFETVDLMPETVWGYEVLPPD